MKRILVLLFLAACQISSLNAGPPDSSGFRRVTVKWMNEIPSGKISVVNGKLINLKPAQGKCRINSGNFRFISSGYNALDIFLDEIRIGEGSYPTIVSVSNGAHSFSFFLRDITFDFPVFIPDYNAIVCLSDDKRTFREIENAIKKRSLLTNIQKIEREPEESFDSASVHTRNQACPIWLGVSRDVRIFQMDLAEEMEKITPLMASSPLTLPETNNTSADYCFLAGRGQGVEQKVIRRIEEGSLPVYHKLLKDDGIKYDMTAFASLEASPLKNSSLEGSHFLVADNYSYGHTFTPRQEKIIGSLLEKESEKKEETLLFFRAKAVNTSETPGYAYFRTLRPGSGWWEKFSYTYEPASGLSFYSPDRVFGISSLNGKPLPCEEISVLLQPGDSALFEFILPHSPVSRARALLLSQQPFTARLNECIKFWKDKLSGAAQISLPEKRINEMVKAGLNHLDLITYGLEPNGILAACPGVYSPIGSESSPIIQFYCSMGLSDIARRSLEFFLEKQYDDGIIQSFGGYMIETGAALCTIGQYFRYTRDTAWINKIKPQLIKSCDYLMKWRDRNKKPELSGHGYGMIDGKVADPVDPYHQFMLNGYGYLGLKRMAEVFRFMNLEEADKLENESDSWKRDIRNSLFNSMANSPVVPLGNGTWCPTVPPWTETIAPRLLYVKPETFLSHGTFTVSDALLGPLNLIYCEVLDPDEPAARMMMDYHSEMFYQRNAAFSQPYYSRHDWVQLKQGLVKPFLKTYYNTFSALADRETYTFWEHLYHVSVHKTHEEAWFLMQTRWMLYLEDGKTLKLLSGIPRKWLEDGKKIELNNVQSYFGPFSLSVSSEINKGIITADLEFLPERLPEKVILRIPHPGGKIPVKVSGGIYNKETESVTVSPLAGKALVRLEY